MNIIAGPLNANQRTRRSEDGSYRAPLRILLKVAKLLKPEGKLTVLTSWGVQDWLLHWNGDSPAEKAKLKEMFDLELDEYPPRYDFINGEWVSREVRTVEWRNAAYEDAMIFEGDAALAVVRFARIGGQNKQVEPRQ